jgi:hypothetical protein
VIGAKWRLFDVSHLFLSSAIYLVIFIVRCDRFDTNGFISDTGRPRTFNARLHKFNESPWSRSKAPASSRGNLSREIGQDRSVIDIVGGALFAQRDCRRLRDIDVLAARAADGNGADDFPFGEQRKASRNSDK